MTSHVCAKRLQSVFLHLSSRDMAYSVLVLDNNNEARIKLRAIFILFLIFPRDINVRFRALI